MEAAGQPVAQICQKLEISAATLARWRSQFRGMSDAEIKRLKEFEEENRLFRPTNALGARSWGQREHPMAAKNRPRVPFFARSGRGGAGRAWDCEVCPRVSVGWLEHSLRPRLRLVRPEGRRH